MKIIDRKTFLTMPAGTVFSKYQPNVFGTLQIKGETIWNDFFVQDIAEAIRCSSSDEFFDILDEAQETGVSVQLDFNCEGRDGEFDEDQWFAVWDNNDVAGLIERLSNCLEETKNE